MEETGREKRKKELLRIKSEMISSMLELHRKFDEVADLEDNGEKLSYVFSFHKELNRLIRDGLFAPTSEDIYIALDIVCEDENWDGGVCFSNHPFYHFCEMFKFDWSHIEELFDFRINSSTNWLLEELKARIGDKANGLSLFNLRRFKDED